MLTYHSTLNSDSLLKELGLDVMMSILNDSFS